MVPCLARALDPLPPSPPNLATTTRRNLHHGEALHLLNQSKTPKQINQIHAQILRHGLSHHPAVLAKLLHLYSSHGRLDHASTLFANFPNPPTFAFNLLIRAYTLNAAPLDALLLYNRMFARGVPPDKFTFPFAAVSCARCADLRKGKEIHASAIKYGFYWDAYLHNTLIHLYYCCGDKTSGRQVFDKMRGRTVVSWTALVSGLVGCGELNAARAVFETMPIRNVVTWTAMIDGCARNGRPDEAFELFRRMQEDEVRPNEFTMVGLLIACTELGSLSLGRWVHEFARKNGMLESGAYVGTALIDMYSKCGSLEDAVAVFDEMPVRSLATWNSMITSLGVHGRGREAILLFRGMERVDVRPDRITFAGLLRACVTAGMVEEGLELFRYMSDRYGSMAGWDHYYYLAELFSCADGVEQVREMVKNLVMVLDVQSQRMFLGASRAQGNIELEKVVCNCIQEMVSLEIHNALPRTEDICYEWEVG